MTNSLVSKLREMLKLEERRESLASELDKLTERLQEMKNRLASPGSAAPAKATARKPRARKTPARRGPGKRRARRGALKEQILAELKNAGPGGVSVKELSDKLGVKNTSVHSWFHTTGKNVSGLKKVGAARYALTSGGTVKAPKSPKATARKAGPKKASKRRGPKKAAAKKTSAKTARAPKASTRKPGGSRRGALMEGILGELKAAGSKGITVKALSEKLNVPYKNVYIWFVTTGKKNPAIKRIAPATYRLQS